MGEIIKRVMSGGDMPFTGERFTGGATGQTEIEHMHRALMARSLCNGKDVLDIASGEGYCSALVAQVARSVVGVDVDQTAVDHANASYARDNLRYMCGNAHEIPLADASVDIVVSFETIEHFRGPERFLEEIRRVLRPGGLAVVSTPDLAIYSVDGEPANPYHVQEMTREEFGSLMGGFFAHVVYLGQRTLVGSALIGDDRLTGQSVHAPFLTYEARGWNAFERSSGLSRARYLVALASDDPAALTLVEQSVFVATSEIDQAVGLHDNLERDLSAARTQILENAASEERWRNDIETVTGWFKRAEQEAERLRETLDQVRREAEANTELQVSAALEAARRESDGQTESLIAELDRAREDREAITARLTAQVDDVKQQVGEQQELVTRLLTELADTRTALQDRDIDASLLGRILAGDNADFGTFSKLVVEARSAVHSADYGRAEGLFRMAVAARPLEGGAWRGYANALHRQGAYRSALGAWQRALAIDAHDPVALAGAGFTLAEMGRREDALARWKAAYSADPRQREVGDRLVAEGLTAAELTDIVLNSTMIADSARRSRPRSYVERLPTLLKAVAAMRAGTPRRAARFYRLLADRCGKACDLIRYADHVAASLGLSRARDIYLRAYALAPDDAAVRRRMMDLRSEDFGFRVQPKVDLRLGADGSYQTLSDDSQFALDPDGRKLPSGWTLISISGDAHGGAIRPVLYAYHGERGASVKAFTFPPIIGKATIRFLVPLPDGVKRLRIDPTGESHVTFHLHRVGWLAGGALEGGAFERSQAGLTYVGEGTASQVAVFPTADVLTLRPQHHLEALGDEFHATGDDPQFAVDGSGKLGGWTWLELHYDQIDAPLDPMLYAFTEGEVVTIALPEMSRAGSTRVLVRLPDRVDQLRFDPTTRPNARFSLPTLRSAPLSRPVDEVLAPCANWDLRSPNLLDSHSEKAVACDVRAQAQLDPLGDGRFRTTGDDPQFFITGAEEPLSGGLVRMTLRIDQLSQPLDATLYAFSDADLPPVSYALRNLGAGRTHEFYLVLPATVRALRFDPCDQPAVTLTMPEITLTPIRPGDDATYQLAEGEQLHDSQMQPGVIATLRAQHHLEEDAAGFRSTGDDPQFEILFGGKPFPRGWTVVTVDVAARDAVIEPVLYCWAGETLTQLRLASLSSGEPSRQLLYFPADLTAMRLDLTDMPDVRFSQPSLTFAPATMFAGHLLKRHTVSERGLDYRSWYDAYDRLTPLDRTLIGESVERLAERPLISVVMPVYNPEPRFLRRALDTVIGQIYPDWELCIADDCSPNPEIRKILQEYADRDPRVKLVFRTENGHISRASNSALELVSGPFVALMDHDDELPAHALYLVAHELNRFPDADIIYSDEDKIDANGRRHDPYFKTDWNRELFYSQNFVAHLGVYRTALVREIGGFRAGFEGSQDYDFTLRILRLTTPERIRHIPHILYHWRIFEGVRSFSSDNPDRSIGTAQRAMLDYFNAVEPDSQVTPIEAFPSWWRIKRQLPLKPPSVTIIVPTRDRIELLRNCLAGVLGATDYPDLDVIVVDNGSEEPESLAYLAAIVDDPRVTVLRDDGPFNYARLNNEAVAQARGEFVCFLNNDIETIAADWLSELVVQALQPGVGAVGTRLLYESGRIQHAGVTVGVYGVAAHGHRHFPGDSIGYFGHPQLVREVSAVTAATLLMPRSLFESLDGFDESHLAVSYNDVDLCLRIREAGYTIVYTPFAALYHLESASRGPDVSPEKKELQRVERGFMQARWGNLLNHDPYYSPNLSLDNEDYGFAFPPRATRPWIDEADVVERLARRARAALPDVDATELSALAQETVIVIASAKPFDTLATIAADLRATTLAPSEIVLVDNSPRTEAFVRDGSVAAFAKAHAGVRLRIIDDPSQDFNASRTANLGFEATDESAVHVVVIIEDCTFASGWFESLLRSWHAMGDSDAVLSPAVFVRENTPRHGVMTDGFIEAPVAQVAESPSAILTMGEDYDGLPLAGRTLPADVQSARAIVASALPASGVLMARRAVFAALASTAGEALFDPLLYTPAARLEDFAIRLGMSGARIFAALAPLGVLDCPRPRDREHLWQYWHDYLWLNRKVHGVADEGVLEFVCPFHRGDVLVGLQVANTAHLAGRQIRFHVADSLVDWVAAFDPPFPVRGLPVPVPPARDTAFYLLQSYEHLLRQPDAGPRLVRSHPKRGLDEMGHNLATAMLTAVGLPADTPIEALVPSVSAEQYARAAQLLAPYGDDVILLHRSGGWGLKTLPDAVLDSFARTVAAKGFRLVQIGGPADEKSRQADGMVAGNFELGLWAALFRQVKAVAGIDSWTAHMAALLDVPQITFFGSTHPAHVASKPYFRKQDAKALLIAPTVACSPCNSLVCLYQPEPYCPGFGANAAVVSAFLDGLRSGADGSTRDAQRPTERMVSR